MRRAPQILGRDDKICSLVFQRPMVPNRLGGPHSDCVASTGSSFAAGIEDDSCYVSLRIDHLFDDGVHVTNKNVDRELFSLENPSVCSGTMFSHDQRYFIWGRERCGDE